jgi:dolichol-phosphate mannosyltransferase
LSFSRNFGHQNALKAGLDYASGDCIISMDGDMQHPPEMIPRMIEIWENEKADIVYTIRKDEQEKVGLFKKTTSRLFYKLLNKIADISMEPGSADFRLLDKSVADIIKKFPENPLFFRGIIPWVGFKQIPIEYIPHKRFWGKTKYSLKKMISFAITGILSFSIKPLLISIYIGIILSFLSFCYGIYAIITKFFTDNNVSGWTSIVSIISFIGGIQLIVLGVIGTYLGKLFIASKGRPMYIIKEKSDD